MGEDTAMADQCWKTMLQGETKQIQNMDKEREPRERSQYNGNYRRNSVMEGKLMMTCIGLPTLLLQCFCMPMFSLVDMQQRGSMLVCRCHPTASRKR